MELTGIATETIAQEAATLGDGGVWEVIVMEGDRWGSSGYYPWDVAQRDASSAFPANTAMYMDHAEGGKLAPPERSLGVLVEAATPHPDGSKRLRAKAKIFSDKRAWVQERAEHGVIELSLRAPVEFERGTREGKSGRIVTAIKPAFSVDVVTKGGAGGKFDTMLESAQNAQIENNQEDEVALTAEESVKLGQDIAAAITAGLAPQFSAITTSLNGLATAQESKDKIVPLTPGAVFGKVAKAKLGDDYKTAVFTAVEALGDKGIDEAGLDALIATESAKETTAKNDKDAADKGAGNGNLKEGVASEDYKSGDIKGWAVATEEKK